MSDAAVRLMLSEENLGLRRKEKDVFIFELANNDDRYLSCVERKE